MSVDRSVAREEGTSRLGPGSRPAASRPSRRSAEDDEQPVPAAGAKGSEESTPASVQAEAQERVETLEQKASRIERELETATKKRIPDLQSALDATRNDLTQAKELAARAATEWPSWIRDAASKGMSAADILKELEKADRQRAESRARELLSNAEPGVIIQELIDSDDPEDLAFARFLRKRQKNGWPISRQNLDRHFEEFSELQSATAKDRDADEKPAAPARKGPPKLAGAGGRDLGGATAGWKPGIDTTTLLGNGFREAAASRR